MVAVTKTYNVTAKRWARGWELHIDGVGVTQTSTLSAADATAREYIALALDIDDESSFDVHVVPQLDAALAEQVKKAREQVREAERLQREAATRQRDVARKLRSGGLSGREIAKLLDVSAQRVSQLIGRQAPKGAVAGSTTRVKKAAARTR
ncbi:hypothetical protein [Amycolatopsis sp. ATCC 39116]|uniref:hypothetical protein n=1 Tax=Amycolatopsis sp. (strain ATCC 39116 / 75iv2) TaxID=385957 RepID=UPI00350E9FA1